ncbi:unnamed protein product [Paramecium sonneborni]|uniref:P-loop containing nucleoside triphosphate hydrolase n=1 Tax=Paramecium sonneborni TaxID=65129 RepID=A0A8S1QVB2_9CILI|nr:unnamed protein product [Paramecium sonneborni]
MSNDYNYMFKYIVVGDTNVGKSCLLLQFTENKFSDHTESTVGVEFGYKTIKLNDQLIKLQIWDTAGQDSFKSITRSYYRGAIGGLLVFDFSRRSTFEDIKKWLKEIKTYSCDKIQLVLVGNKSDLPNKDLTIQEVQEYAQQEKLDFYEASAKTGQNVDVVFESVAIKILRKIETKQINLDDQMLGIKVNLNGKNKKKSKLQNNQSPYYNITLNGKQNQEEKNDKKSCC